MRWHKVKKYQLSIVNLLNCAWRVWHTRKLRELSASHLSMCCHIHKLSILSRTTTIVGWSWWAPSSSIKPSVRWINSSWFRLQVSIKSMSMHIRSACWWESSQGKPTVCQGILTQKWLKYWKLMMVNHKEACQGISWWLINLWLTHMVWTGTNLSISILRMRRKLTWWLRRKSMSLLNSSCWMGIWVWLKLLCKEFNNRKSGSLVKSIWHLASKKFKRRLVWRRM